MSDKHQFTCIGGHTFSETELEMGMTQATMDYYMAEQEREHNLACHESFKDNLGREYMSGEENSTWPWDMDHPDLQEPFEICEPEILPYGLVL